MVLSVDCFFLSPVEVRGITNRKTVVEGYENVQAALLDYTLTCYPSVPVSIRSVSSKRKRPDTLRPLFTSIIGGGATTKNIQVRMQMIIVQVKPWSIGQELSCVVLCEIICLQMATLIVLHERTYWSIASRKLYCFCSGASCEKGLYQRDHAEGFESRSI